MSPRMPDAVAAAFAAFPDTAHARLDRARALIFALAEETGTGPLTETLKWGEPAYLTERTKSGTTIRLGLVSGAPAVLFNCQTTLVDSFRTDLPDVFQYSGNRALLLPYDPDEQALSLCLSRALTYHRGKRRI
ncbi:DUF1801 domain-containing protein [Psychromarinibacter sp. C21-152]|uniref:DUF1801 domain-containing protein n=1 Tax=Psychromarinibacter sediminicola TaxID=3033385 RepID=A0AAE3NML2_9RHOB|nr:DUF1801 domain-containing protein [Psychromarinibacter sediminicola]MDF0600663.1 DUF1801 domain-containing protein [Psychromarinibacter sediminicola]